MDAAVAFLTALARCRPRPCTPAGHEELEDLLEQVLGRLTLQAADTGDARQRRPSAIRYGVVGLKGLEDQPREDLDVATISFTLRDEAETIRSIHPELAEQSTNVAVLAMGLAEWPGTSAEDVRGFGVAGLLHDLGKVRIPQEVLVMPGKARSGRAPVDEPPGACLHRDDAGLGTSARAGGRGPAGGRLRASGAASS